MRAGVSKTLRVIGERSILWLKIAVLVLAGLMPALTFEKAEAAQLTSRKVTISTSEGSVSANHTYNFTLPSVIDVEGIIFEYCTNPLGTCTKPTGLDLTTATTSATQTWTQTTDPWAEVGVSTGDCNIAGTSADTKYCVERTEPGSEAADGKELTIDAVTNPDLSGTTVTFYVRISLYDNATFTSGGGAGSQIVHEGTVAAAIVEQLTVTGRVAERLRFCIGAINDGDNSGVLGTDDTPADCTTGFPSTTEVTLGVLDDQDIYITPVEDTANNLSSDNYGIAIVNTNASGGVVVTYYAEPADPVSSSDTDQLRTFRVMPTDCSNNIESVTDQCFRPPTDGLGTATDNTSFTFTQGQERFGMYIPCIDSHHDSISTVNLTATAAYTGTDGDATEADAEEASTCQYDEGMAGGVPNGDFAWNTSSTPATIASSTTVVDNEAIKLAFGATASPTTPEGSYLVILTYVATPTF